ncbi:hypothetical protein F5884DRAFT_213526 [Xylogone sp. PMI_703]|nr:hypothetical protein F5884DRAFT_213526 [Xylogone sp. PMI_703]
MSPLAPGNVLSNALPRPTPPPGIPTQRQFNVGPALQAATPAPGASIALTANQQSQTSKVTETSGTHTKENVKPLTPNTGLSKAPASSSLGSHTSSSIQPEDFPALERTGEKFEQISVPSKQPIPTPIAKLDNKTGSQAPGMDAPNKTPSKRSTPGILNITVPTATQPPSTPETNHKSTLAPSAFPPLPPSAPPIPTQSPAPKAAPKMLRVIPTPKADVPAGSIATPSSATSTVPINFPPSRQPSLASASRLERPATPASENVSDNASITSASLSRASSPPPSKVGSAPVRTTTKSMQKKQRREAQKEKEKSAVEATILKPEPEVEIAPIVGRKKKQKKEKISNNTAGGSTPVVSRPASPGAGAVAVATKTEVITREPLPLAPEKPLSPSKDINKAKVNDAKGKSKSKSKNIAPVETTATITEQPEEAPEKQITPSWALQQLVSSGFIKDPTSLGLLQPPVGVNHRHEFSGEASNVDQKLTITQEDESALLSGKPVHKIVEGSRILLTPSGNCVRNLTPEEEERYLELQSQLSKEPPVVTFNSGKEHANKGFTLIGGRAVPSGSTAFLPSSSGPSSQFDPVTKIHHDEALNYINQYVLPSLATPLQLEKALNTTGPNPEANQPESTIWARWMNDASATGSERSESASGMANRADILAAGWASMAAQFAIGHENEKNDTLGNVSLLSVDEAESAIQLARKETEVLEKKLNVLIKKNRRLLLGSGH